MNKSPTIIPNNNPNLVSIEIEHFTNILNKDYKIIYNQSGKAQPFPLYKTPVIAWAVSNDTFNRKNVASAVPILASGLSAIQGDTFIIQDTSTGHWYCTLYGEGKDDKDLCCFLADMAREKYLDVMESKAAKTAKAA